MSGRLSLGLVAVLIILGGYVYFFELSEAGSPPEVQSPLLLYPTTYNEYDIVEFEIVTAAQRAHFVRTDTTLTQDWQMISPELLRPPELDQVRVNGAAVRLGRLTAGQVITTVTNLAQYDLAPPALTVTLTISNGQTVTLLTGGQTPVNNQRYIQTQADPQSVYLVPSLAVDALHDLLTFPPLTLTP
ncbi:MAG: DUF4340 domain-containing protein [Anaerolineae bacterium]|nr:DUF4340 domain-containing protein [Anaerolineae bacterium]